MNNKLLAIGGIAVLVVGFALLMMPASIPLLDANRRELAQTDAEGYCAGQVLVESRGKGDVKRMGDCIAESNRSKNIDLRQVQKSFCQGIHSKAPEFTFSKCMTEVKEGRIWPTLTGRWTNSWNKHFPYPLDQFGVATQLGGDESRTGEREGNERNGVGRE